LRGVVVDLERTPLAGVKVVAQRGAVEAGSVETGPDGAYSLALPAGDYEVTASKPGLTRRTRRVSLAADGQVLSFGPVAEDLGNPFFLADDPEIEQVEVTERAPGQGLAVTLRLSEPLSAASRVPFERALRLNVGSETEFLKVASTTVPRRALAGAWSDDGRAFTVRYEGPYLASGELDAWYSVSLLQRERPDERDPATRETLWDDLGIVDDTGRRLGRGQMRFAFRVPELFPLGPDQLNDKAFGFYIQDRRWRLTHQSLVRFRAARDSSGPTLVNVQFAPDRTFGAAAADELILTLDEPMSAARRQDDLYWTPLEAGSDLVILNGSKEASGPAFQPVTAGLRPREVLVDRADPRLVSVLYPVGTFDDLARLEVTLGPAFKDPAGNAPNPAGGKRVVVLK
jgi:hypothetical protein